MSTTSVLSKFLQIYINAFHWPQTKITTKNNQSRTSQIPEAVFFSHSELLNSWAPSCFKGPRSNSRRKPLWVTMQTSASNYKTWRIFTNPRRPPLRNAEICSLETLSASVACRSRLGRLERGTPRPVLSR